MTKTADTYKDSISDVHGNLVVSFEEGDCLGKVGDIYFDKATCALKGISLVPSFSEPEEKNYVKFKDILKLGNSVVIVSKKGALGKLPGGLINNCLRLLRDLKIVTQDGENLGEMSDLTVDAETGVVRELHMFGDKKIQIDVEKDKIRIGRDMIVIPVAYKERITNKPKDAGNTKQTEDPFGNVVKTAGMVTRKFADSLSEAINMVKGEFKSGEAGNNEASTSKTPTPKAKKAAQKTTAKKAPAKKAPAKKAPAKKAPAKKVAEKKD